MTRIWSVLAFSTAIACTGLALFNQIMFMMGAGKVCHYTPFNEWIIELPVVLFSLIYISKYTWENV